MGVPVRRVSLLLLLLVLPLMLLLARLGSRGHKGLLLGNAAAALAAAASAPMPTARRRGRPIINGGGRSGFLLPSPATTTAALHNRCLSSSAPSSSTVVVMMGRGRGSGSSSGGKSGGGKGDKISKGKKKGDLPEKTCVVCGRPFTWRAKWADVWEEVKYCSDRCRGQRGKQGSNNNKDATTAGGGGDGGTQQRISSSSGSTGAYGDGLLLSRRRFSTGLAAALVGAAVGGGSRSIGTRWPVIPAPAMAAEGALRPKPGEIEALLQAPEAELWPDATPPYTRDDFRRLDEGDDARFYDEPKLVEHIDAPAVRALEQYYAQALPALAQSMYGDRQRRLDVLDLGASWVSHLPPTYDNKDGASASASPSSRVAGLGMNAAELAQNNQLTEYTVHDLNKSPTLPYPDAAFDCVVCALSIDYLIRPISVLSEVARVLRPGGMVAIAFSNRLFIQKAVSLWTGKADEDHVLDVATFLHYAGNAEKGLFDKSQARDLSPSPTKGDPLYVVTAAKRK